MNLSRALRTTGLLAATSLTLGLASCGYSPLYAPGAGATAAAGRVQIGKVEIAQEIRNVGQRRPAQTVAQDLKLNFPNQGTEMDTLDVYIDIDEDTLAVERTAAVQRAQINLVGTVILTNPNGDQLLKTELSTNAPYNVEITPYSTETGKTYARLTASRNLAAEISRRVYLYYSTHPLPAPKPVKTRK